MAELLNEKVWFWEDDRLIRGTVINTPDEMVGLMGGDGFHYERPKDELMFTPQAVRDALANRICELARMWQEFDQTITGETV